MTPDVEVLLAEYSELRQSERALRAQLHVISGFALTVMVGLFVGIGTYKLQPLALVAPLALYLIGYQCHSDALRMLRMVAHCRTIERNIRQRVVAEPPLPAGFEDATLPGYGLRRFFYYANSFAGGAIFYGIAYYVSFCMLFSSSYSALVRYGLGISYIVMGGTIWFLDVRANWHFIVPRSEQAGGTALPLRQASDRGSQMPR